MHIVKCTDRGILINNSGPITGNSERGEQKMEETIRLVMMGATVAIGGIAPAAAIGILTGKAMEAMGRNPEAAGEIRTTMILGVAFAEAIAIYSLVIALIIRFV